MQRMCPEYIRGRPLNSPPKPVRNRDGMLSSISTECTDFSWIPTNRWQ